MGRPVLVVDDSATVRLQVRHALQGAGYDVIEAGDGQEGLEKIEAFAPALVLCDVNMPRLGGIDLLGKLGGMLASLPVVMLTTEGQPAMIRKARDAGARGWIVKPFHPDLLVKAVQRLVT